MNKIVDNIILSVVILSGVNIHAANLSWYMDWAKYGGVHDASKEKSTEAVINEVADIDNKGIHFKDKISPNLNRVFGTNFQSIKGKDVRITPGPFFKLVAPDGVDLKKYKVSYFGKDCLVEPESKISTSKVYDVSCTKVHQDFMTPLGQLGALAPSKKVMTGPYSAKSHPFGQHFEYEEPVTYSSYAMQYWEDKGVDFAEAFPGTNFEPYSHSSECALMAEKTLFAIGYFIKNKPEFIKYIDETKDILKAAMDNKNADSCFELGRKIKCGKSRYNETCPEIKPKPFGWLDIWDVRGEFSMRKIFEAKRDFFKKIGLDKSLKNDSRYLRIVQAKKDINAGKAVVYEEPMMVWGYQEDIKKPIHGKIFPAWRPEDQMNKVGRLWNFMMVPVTVEEK